jgi:hypothetical protein
MPSDRSRVVQRELMASRWRPSKMTSTAPSSRTSSRADEERLDATALELYAKRLRGAKPARRPAHSAFMGLLSLPEPSKAYSALAPGSIGEVAVSNEIGNVTWGASLRVRIKRMPRSGSSCPSLSRTCAPSEATQLERSRWIM